MSPFDEGVTPGDVLRAAARLVSLDGWDPTPGVRIVGAPKYGRFYSSANMIYTIMRVRHLINCSWMAMVRATEALHAALGVAGDAAVSAWERVATRTSEQIERALLRAAYRYDARVAA